MENRKPMKINTMTLQECVDKMRGLGLRTTETTVGAMLEAGKYPFGIACRPYGKNLVVEIYEELFWKWVDERAVPVE